MKCERWTDQRDTTVGQKNLSPWQESNPRVCYADQFTFHSCFSSLKMLLLLMFCVAWDYSGAPAAPRVAKRSTVTKGTTTPNDDDDVALHGGLTRANSKSCSLGFQRISLVVDIHVMVNWHLPNQVSADQYHVTISLAQVYSSLSTCVFFSWPSTGLRLDRGLMSG